MNVALGHRLLCSVILLTCIIATPSLRADEFPLVRYQAPSLCPSEQEANARFQPLLRAGHLRTMTLNITQSEQTMLQAELSIPEAKIFRSLEDRECEVIFDAVTVLLQWHAANAKEEAKQKEASHSDQVLKDAAQLSMAARARAQNTPRRVPKQRKNKEHHLSTSLFAIGGADFFQLPQVAPIAGAGVSIMLDWFGAELTLLGLFPQTQNVESEALVQYVGLGGHASLCAQPRLDGHWRFRACGRIGYLYLFAQPSGAAENIEGQSDSLSLGAALAVLYELKPFVVGIEVTPQIMLTKPSFSFSDIPAVHETPDFGLQVSLLVGYEWAKIF